MEDNDEIYVMADPNSLQVTPVPPQRRFPGKTLWLLGGLIAIATGILAYILVNQTPVACPWCNKTDTYAAGNFDV
ncbi:MAG: hypothetical protein KME52_21590 [Desmonostoc geniculatum HA4340-LM1]|jgi:hypothetical protein|nr:hypothetical protein [Desmonostoc geniculatum HA4340-LM1]